MTPPAWVNSTMRRTTRAVASRFSVPLSMAMRAPLETGSHSTGMPRASARSIAAAMRSHSGADSEPMEMVGSESSSTRLMPSGTFSVGVVMMPKTMAALFPPKGRPATLMAVGWVASGSRSNSSKRPTGSAGPWALLPLPEPPPVSMRTIS
jgi:hypothetical protein